jgi:hypothetical protein
MSHRFGTSAPEAKNGFVGRRIVSSCRCGRNNRGLNASNFKGGLGRELFIPGSGHSPRLDGMKRLMVRDGASAPAHHEDMNLSNYAFSPAGENR